jgi:hypothetical protein
MRRPDWVISSGSSIREQKTPARFDYKPAILTFMLKSSSKFSAFRSL